MTEEADTRAPSSSRATALVFGVGGGIASTVYGTIMAMSTIAAYGRETHPWKLDILVMSTASVLWIAHVYAHALSESISLRRPLRVDSLAPIARRELGIVLAGVLPSIALLLGAAEILAERSAVWLALGLCLGTLAVEGVRYAQLERVGPTGTVTAVALNVGLGLCVVALKVALTH